MNRKVCVALCAVVCSLAVKSWSQTPEIRLGTPKAWRYDRVYPQLDALMRDVEGTSLKPLLDLDPSAMNSSLVTTLQTYVGVAATYDQGAGITNTANLKQFQAAQPGQLASITAQSDVTQKLYAKKSQLTTDLIAALDAQTAAVLQVPAKTACADDTICAAATLKATQIQSELTAVNGAISSSAAVVATPAPTIASVAPGGTTPPTLSSALGGDAMKALFNNAAAGKSGIGSIPPREQLESFITLLNEFSMKKLAMSLDEWGESGNYIPVVVEFDVSIEPGKGRKDEKAASEFVVKNTDTEPSCSSKRPIVYNQYPSMAAFNVSSVDGVSSGASIAGAFKWLAVGASVNVQRQRDRLQQSMQQSVYISGYHEQMPAEAGDANPPTTKLGWFYGAPAFMKVARPGTYATFAIVLVPKRHQGVVDDGASDELCNVQISGATYWTKDGRIRGPVAASPNLVPAGSLVPPAEKPWVHSVQYYPHQGTDQTLAGDTNTVSIEFVNPVDPNLIVMTNGTTLRRVRDSRGRATGSNATLDNVTVMDSSGKSQTISRSRGLLEADMNDPDTWIAVSQRKIILRLSAKLAGTSQFPDIRFIVPGEGQLSLAGVLDYRTYDATLTAGAKTYYACHPKLSEFRAPLPGGANNVNDGCMPQPLSVWYPLFSHVAETNHKLSVTRIQTNDIDAPDDSKNDQQFGIPAIRTQDRQQYYFLRVDDGASLLDANALVTISSPAHKRLANPIALECAPLEGGLLCHTHVQTVVFGKVASALRCLATDSTKAGRLAYQPGSESCGWENYRLQLDVFQPGTVAGQEPMVATLPLPSFATSSGVVVGKIQSLQKTPTGWRAEYPVYYPSIAILPRNVCFGTSGSSRVDARIIALNNNGPVERGGVLSVDLQAYDPLLNVKSALIWDGVCTGNQNVILGTVVGLQRKAFGQVTITKFGDKNSVYQMAGTGLDSVDRVMTYGDSGYINEKVANVIAVDANTLIVNVTGLDANGKNAFLYFGAGPSRVPVMGCVTTPGPVTPKKAAIPEVLGKEEVRGKDGTLIKPAVPYKPAVPEVPEVKGPDVVKCGPVLVAAQPAPQPSPVGKGGKKAPNEVALTIVPSTASPKVGSPEAQTGEKTLNVPVRIQ